MDDADSDPTKLGDEKTGISFSSAVSSRRSSKSGLAPKPVTSAPSNPFVKLCPPLARKPEPNEAARRHSPRPSQRGAAKNMLKENHQREREREAHELKMLQLRLQFGGPSARQAVGGNGQATAFGSEFGGNGQVTAFGSEVGVNASRNVQPSAGPSNFSDLPFELDDSFFDSIDANFSAEF
ncbi:hypothetical protein C8R44DRAFT_871554 [Mycena epipterygia]|nr:hypothetical protein C8R44DRAFT_871554 [Mycena epipterygia]